MTHTEYEYSSIIAKKEAKRQRDIHASLAFALKLLFSVLAAMIFIQSLWLRIELNRQNDLNLSLVSSIKSAEYENRRLIIDCEYAADLEELEKKASEAGMIRPQVYQIIRIKDTADKHNS